MNIPDHIFWELRNNCLGLKILKFFDADPGSGIFWPWIQNLFDPGSATLEKTYLGSGLGCSSENIWVLLFSFLCLPRVPRLLPRTDYYGLHPKFSSMLHSTATSEPELPHYISMVIVIWSIQVWNICSVRKKSIMNPEVTKKWIVKWNISTGFARSPLCGQKEQIQFLWTCSVL